MQGQAPLTLPVSVYGRDLVDGGEGRGMGGGMERDSPEELPVIRLSEGVT